MFFEDHEKQIYADPVTGRKFDPLAVHRSLVVHTHGKVNELLAEWQGEDAVIRAVAEGKLVLAARAAFSAKPFDQEDGLTDAQVLESLCLYSEWMRGKGTREPTQPR